MDEAWSTPEQLAAKIAEHEAYLAPHWDRPAAWGILHDGAGGRVVADRAEAGQQVDLLALLTLAIVAGDCCGSYVTRIGAAELDLAIAMLAPAAGCAGYPQSNLRAWQYLR